MPDGRRFLVAGAALAALLAVGAADAAGGARQKAPPRATPARSLGSPTRGSLEGGVALPLSPFVALRKTPAARWGLPALVGLLERSARRVARFHPGSVLLVGDLSTRRGGQLGGHRSHQSGRDADVGFYYIDSKRRRVAVTQFLRVDEHGRVAGRGALHFDDARNWALVESWIIDPGARVQHVFVAEELRQRLLAHARSVGAHPPVLYRAAHVLKQPSRGLVHDDHFHVRIACPRDQREGCVSEPDSDDVAARHAPQRPAQLRTSARATVGSDPGS